MISPKVAFSLAGTFLAGLTGYYELHSADPMTARFWVALVMAGLAPIGSYLLGYNQVNPRLDPVRRAARPPIRFDVIPPPPGPRPAE
jgi:hypothetical protein